MESERIWIWMDTDAETETARQVLEQAGIPVQTEWTDEGLRLHIASADSDRAGDILFEADLCAEMVPEDVLKDKPNGKRTAWMVVVMLVLIALAVYGTDFIVELLRKLFQ